MARDEGHADARPGTLAFTQNWESFLGKLSVPVTEDLAAGDICRRYLSVVSVAMYSGPPRTLIHNDVHGDNLLVAEDGEQSLAIVDWQLTTPARPGPIWPASSSAI